jgi:hypothetical protein
MEQPPQIGTFVTGSSQDHSGWITQRGDDYLSSITANQRSMEAEMARPGPCPPRGVPSELRHRKRVMCKYLDRYPSDSDHRMEVFSNGS